ncbi:MAG: SGNH/GDSL hydrolase family protein [Clostridia bacterium]|nr:SGNH/GDSL hydrolase family protein [Clostridia bacterium]
MEENPLYGKKISFNGDSICEGVGYPGGYGKIIAERNNMEYQNIGVGGGTVATEVYSHEEAHYWISANIGRMDADADYAIVEGGVNDSSHWEVYGTPAFGELTEGYSGPFDETTFIGGFESMLKQLTARFAGKKIGYIAVHQCSGHFRPSIICGEENNLYLAAKACCRKWGVPFLDLTATVPPISYIRAKFGADPALEFISVESTKNNDGCHPNEYGYNSYYCDKIEEWLMTL